MAKMTATERLVLYGVPWVFRVFGVVALFATFSPWEHVRLSDRVVTFLLGSWLLWLQREMPVGGRSHVS